MIATLHPNHADDTGASNLPDWFDCHPDALTTVTTALVPDPDRPGSLFLEIRTESRDRVCGTVREGGVDTRVTEQWLRQMRALIDRALGDRT